MNDLNVFCKIFLLKRLFAKKGTAKDRNFVAILDREKCILYKVFSKMQTKKKRYAAAPILYPINLSLAGEKKREES